jgi:hypothetical protein
LRHRLRQDVSTGVDRGRSRHGRYGDLPPYRRPRRPGPGHFQTPALASFTTPRGTSALGRDVAIGAKIVAVSSQWSSAYSAANAVDGNLSTAWASNGDGDRAFITIDLGRERKITGISFITREMSDGSAITRTYAVVVDGRRRYGPFPAGSPVDPHIVPVSFTGRFLRFEVVRSTGGNTGAAEIEVFSAI